MRALRLAAFELRRFRGRLPLLGLAFLVIVPTLYGSMYLWSNWDPYGNLDDLPVAVVDEDRPVTVDGERVAAGETFVEQLRARPQFDWRFTDAADAREGLEDGRYAFTMRVPPDFSAKLASPRTDDPERAHLDIRLDDANGYIIGVIAQTAEAEIQREINAAAYSAYASAALGGLAEVRSGLVEASRGARKLADGTGEAHSGARQLATGARELNSGAARLEDGSAEVRDGVRELQGVVDAAGDVVGDAAANADATLAELGADVRRGAARARERARDAREQLDALRAASPDLADTAAFRALSATVTRLDDAAAEASTRATALGRRLEAIPDDAASRVRSGVAKVDELADGAAQVADGAARLHDGTRQARAGALELSKGTKQLDDGADELATKLSDAVKQIPPSDADERSRQADVLANPVALDTTNSHPAVEYGRGLAPFFLSIALWVFGLVAYLMLRPVSGTALASRLPAHVVALGAWLPAFALGIVGATVLYLVVDVGLGLDPESVPGTLGLAFLAVGAFTALLHLLRLAFGAVGDAIALLLLVLQLAATGGIYPIETAPAPLQVLHPILPMTYLIDAFRITISGGQGAHLLVDVAVLGGLLVVLLALTTLTVRRRRTWTMAQLKPQLEL